MFAVHPERLQIRWAVMALVNEAVDNARTLHCSQAADQLAARYPNCGMSVREIEDEIIRQIGLARGSAAIGDGFESRIGEAGIGNGRQSGFVRRSSGAIG